MSERPYNFSSGPATMPVEVLAEAAQGLIDWQSTGVGVPEMSHRSDEFLSIIQAAETDFRDLLDIGDDYSVLFLQNGASGQFTRIPQNLGEQSATADYVITGTWGEKAVKAADKQLDTQVAARAEGYTYVPDSRQWELSDGGVYVHITSNETIEGVAFSAVPEVDRPLVADMSSSILSEPLEVNKFGVIYAGAQKNIGPAGLTMVIVRNELLGRARTGVDSVDSWEAQAKAGSMVNTPPTFEIYVAGLVLKWLKAQGGLETMAERNQRKAGKLYDAIDDSELYANPVQPEFRSRMSVPFILQRSGSTAEATQALESKFLEQAGDEGLRELKGHRSVGGFRACLYNAMPQAGVDKLVSFMRSFEEAHA
jgi:phosphoserine aminotransferase